MKTTIFACALGICMFGASVTGHTQPIVFQELRSDGGPVYLDFANKEQAPRRVVFYHLTDGHQSESFYFRTSGAKGVTVRARQVMYRGNYEPHLRPPRKGFPVPLYNTTQLANRHNQCVDISVESPEEDPELTPAMFPPSWNEVCEEIGHGVLGEIAESFNTLYGGGWTAEHICTYVMMEVPWDELDDLSELEFAKMDNGKRDLRGVISKNACLKRPGRYLVKFIVNLRAVPWEEYPHGLTLQARFKTNPYNGGKQSSIKPESEGRHAPKPIVLMNSIGGVCGHRVDVVQWRQRRVVRRRSLAPYSIIPWNNMMLVGSVVSPVLGGGRATFELYNQNHAYGACFRLRRARQVANGYPQ